MNARRLLVHFIPPVAACLIGVTLVSRHYEAKLSETKTSLWYWQQKDKLDASIADGFKQEIIHLLSSPNRIRTQDQDRQTLAAEAAARASRDAANALEELNIRQGTQQYSHH